MGSNQSMPRFASTCHVVPISLTTPHDHPTHKQNAVVNGSMPCTSGISNSEACQLCPLLSHDKAVPCFSPHNCSAHFVQCPVTIPKHNSSGTASTASGNLRNCIELSSAVAMRILKQEQNFASGKHFRIKFI